MARNHLSSRTYNKYYYQLFEWPKWTSAKTRKFADWEVFLNKINLIKSIKEDLSPTYRLENYPDFVRENLILLEDFDEHILGNISYYTKKIVRERTTRLAWILVSLSLLLLVPIGVAQIQKNSASVPASISAMLTGFFALYQGVSKYLEKRNVIGTYWQTKSNLLSRLLSIESKWRYSHSVDGTDIWTPEKLEELRVQLQEAVTFGLDCAKTEKQLFFENYNYPQFNILGSILGVRGQLQQLLQRQEGIDYSRGSDRSGSAPPVKNPRTKLAELTEKADEPTQKRNAEPKAEKVPKIVMGAALKKVPSLKVSLSIQNKADKESVKAIQEKLGISVDGDFGPGTQRAVINFQIFNDLLPDGIVNNTTWQSLMASVFKPEDIEKVLFYEKHGLRAHKYYIPNPLRRDGETRENYDFRDPPLPNEYAFLHHTAGWHNPFKVVDDWGTDGSGRVGTEFVVGGQNCTNGDSTYDGVMVQAFPEGAFADHIGKDKRGKWPNRSVRKNSTGIEICSFGQLENGKTYTNTSVHPSQICTLDQPFRGFIQYHKYSDKQIEEVRKWILMVGERDGIDYRVGLRQWIIDGRKNPFEFDQDAFEGKVRGLLTHTNVRREKTDCYPDPRLIEMIRELK